jgi:hypothetical protein
MPISAYPVSAFPQNIRYDIPGLDTAVNSRHQIGLYAGVLRFQPQPAKVRDSVFKGLQSGGDPVYGSHFFPLAAFGGRPLGSLPADISQLCSLHAGHRFGLPLIRRTHI